MSLLQSHLRGKPFLETDLFLRPVTADEEARYTSIIDNILRTSDLATVSRKKVRRGLEDKIGKDLESQKVCWMD